MNAKETLQKIAEALNIVDAQPAVEENVEQPVVEAQVEEQPVVEESKPEEPVADQPVVEEPVVEEQPEAQPEPVAENSEVELLKKQLDDMKEILKNALAQPDEPVVPEIPKEEPQGLTHSPEAQVRQKAKGIGRKGDDIMSRVFKYMNNN